MKNYLIIAVAILFFTINSCQNSNSQNTKTSLAATEFAQKIKDTPAAPILDVRTPDEFSKGHLVNAKNVDWNGTAFESSIAVLAKDKPVFVYCLSGGRSAAAAAKMRELGFKEVYELEGGIMKWRAANLPETTESTAAVTSSGMSLEEFKKMIKSDKLVLVDFYADWCGPCKKIKPYLEEISKEMEKKVVVYRINVDQNPNLTKELGIDALPTLQVYKKDSLVWNNIGYIEKAYIIKHLK
ncbi:MAG: thioredoxin [Bacteroidota bacterium]